MGASLSEATQGSVGMLWNVSVGAASTSAGRMKESTVVFFQEKKWKEVPKTAWIMTAGTVGLFAAGVWSRSPAFLTLNVITGACVIFTIRQVPWKDMLEEYRGVHSGLVDVKDVLSTNVDSLRDLTEAQARLNEERLKVLNENQEVFKRFAKNAGATIEELKDQTTRLDNAAERHKAANAEQERINAQMQQMTRMPELLEALRELVAKVDAQDATAQRAQSLISSIPVSVAVAT